MSKKIKFTYEEKEYTLEFTRKTVSMAEEEGFNITEIDSKPATMLPILFKSAFYKNHRSIRNTPDLLDKIYDSLDNKDELLPVLMEIYTEPIQTLTEGKGEVKWKTVG
ncbi:DUF5055 domain-containing protein [Anaerofustis stercorihominis]|uniref:DUF5055 domain-containing protein n=1 Tax=Anaerofustis stercorihominis TaxID=214853 RepID=UPI00214AA1CA|nr:DUF5055 domain-containing protein [Anaerofustis stercorihominis]MCR2033716.1 DUF5055 domain-containing protein [Anaerofustis stercorihominis]